MFHNASAFPEIENRRSGGIPMKIDFSRAAQLTMALGLAFLVQRSEGQAATGRANPVTSESSSASVQVPLEFESNRGQAPAPYSFVAHGPSYSLALSATQVALTLHSGTQSQG